MPSLLPSLPDGRSAWPYHIFGCMLRFWRIASGLSQEDLADRARMSVRHLSFLENGKTRPSMMAVRRLSEIIGLGPREHDTLLIAAGHAPTSAALMCKPVQDGVGREDWPMILNAADPVPTSFMRPSGDILAVNRAWLVLHRRFLDGLVQADELNALDLLLHAGGWRSHLANWQDVASAMLTIVLQAVLLSGDRSTLERLQGWLAGASLPEDWAMTGSRLSGGHTNYSFSLSFGREAEPVARVVHSSLGYYPGKSIDTVIQQSVYPQDAKLRAFIAEAIKSCSPHPLCPA